MTELNQAQMQEVNGGLLFAVVPLGYCVLTVATELAVIAAMAASKS